MNKNLIVLTLGQIFSFTAAPVTVFLSGIIGSQISPLKSLSTLPMSISVVGIAIGAILATKVMSLIGRKAGFISASIGNFLASILAAYSIMNQNFILFCFANFKHSSISIFAIPFPLKSSWTVILANSNLSSELFIIATVPTGTLFSKAKKTCPPFSIILSGLSNIFCKTGDWLEKGMVLGDINNNNNSNLYMEFRFKGKTIRPSKWAKLK